MKKILLMAGLVLVSAGAAACTNFIVGKKASVDGSVFVTYNADSYGAFMPLYHYTAAKHQAGDMRKVYEWDTNKYLGEIAEAPETWNVIGNSNEWQVTIGETTFGGRHEMADSTGIVDYGSLIYITLQRAKTAREALQIMTSLVEQYGYYSEGETFSVADKDEAWMLEMMGCGPDREKSKERTVWVAVRIPDDAIAAHANQSRITKFLDGRYVQVKIKDLQKKYPVNGKKAVPNLMVCSDNVVSYARTMGWFDGKDADFSYNAAYAEPDFSGRRYCEARVWSFFNRFSDDFSAYVPYAAGIEKGAKEMPLWIIPNKKVGMQDLRDAMRDHYEGTPFALDTNIGGGIYEMPYRPSPLSYKVDGVEVFNERPISTQQTAWSFISQMRSWLPREIGGCFWFGNDDGNMVAYTPMYSCITTVPKCFSGEGADDVTFSIDNAFWVCNWVSNMIYPRYSMMFPSLKEVRDSLDASYDRLQPEIEAKAKALATADERIKLLTDYSCQKGDEMISRWRQLAFFLIVKYNDMAVKPTDKNGTFERSPYGNGARVKRPGYPESYAKELLKLTGDKYKVPVEEKK
ncbi:C69 family dipeptidase [Prevotella sp. FD3004]|uniref:C69 family dipeptidase n=1 Tax=Prevotella sp. FD3004 TaxID=1408309 RepID=UPI0005610CB3|nr:C69 family dipeptidase [Prevotella sp. FD3004]MCR5469541.1 C69 family dipeptidase [Prevotella sp.]